VTGHELDDQGSIVGVKVSCVADGSSHVSRDGGGSMFR
jgi:hypothetical protein